MYQERQHDDYSFKIDNGDFLQGSPLCHYLATEEQSSQPIGRFWFLFEKSVGKI
jgi:2',3'-cyclic-nucleotide 2'-phosphodiesterase (5'-nucleotidase family)